MAQYFLLERSGWPRVVHFVLFLRRKLPCRLPWTNLIGRKTIHRIITEHRRRLICEHDKEIFLSFLRNSFFQTVTTPWKAILTSPPVYALTIAHCAHNWGFWTILTEIPSYMKNVLHFNIKENALLSALPYFAMMCMSLILSPFADWMNNKRILRVGFSRKLFNTIGLWGPMTALICLAFISSASQAKLAVTLVTVAVGINAATYLGFQINHLDLAPKHSGTLMGITNCCANICSIVAPLLVGNVLVDPVSTSVPRD